MAKKKTKKIKTADGKVHTVQVGSKADAKYSAQAGSSSSSSSSSQSKDNSSSKKVTVPTVNYNYDSKNESVSQYNARVTKEKAARDSALATAQKEGKEIDDQQAAVNDEYEKSELETELKNSGLPDDQQEAIRALYDSISTNDRSKMEGYVSALKAGLELADPVFKAQSRVLLDELDRSIKGKENDVAYRENQLRTTLSDLQRDLGSSSEFLGLEEQNDLKALERQMGEDLTGLRDNLAASGLTSSSIRSRKEEILNESYGDLRESKTRSYKQQQESLTNQGTRGQRDTEAEIARLQELLKADKLSLISDTEKEVGSQGLKDAGYETVLGKLPGNIEQKKYDYADQFARSFVF